MTVQRAVKRQAEVTGAASHYGAQSTVQADKHHEARRRAAINLISKKGTAATLAALTPLPDMGRRRRDDDDDAEPQTDRPRGEDPMGGEGLTR
ncbi:MAG TPA: hypothetical protein VFH51_02260 [Myxococcota bacterium]|nr:hypothetical protein [Myxococcota bacterium]